MLPFPIYLMFGVLGDPRRRRSFKFLLRVRTDPR